MDKRIRVLEKKVLAGDLSAVIPLAAAYQRSGQAPPLPVDIIYEALQRASRELGVIAQYSGDVEYWNSGGDGYKALTLADLAVRILEGKNVTMEEYTDVINSEPGLICSNCGDEVDALVDGMCESCG